MFASLSGLIALVLQVVSLVVPGDAPKPAAAVQPASQAICPAPTSTTVTCLSWVRALHDHQFSAATTAKALPAGYGPSQLATAYGAPVTSGTTSLAIITAYDNPRAATDLATYDQTFGLPSFPACATAGQTSCFAKISQTGSTTFLPVANRSWSLEADLDVQTAHALCPNCRLTLVEANSASFANLLTAVDRAVVIGAHVVSMSWGTNEFAGQTSYDSHFANPNVNFVAASGDSGYGTGWPAASNHVLAVSGTHLTLASNNTRTAETVWSGSGSGCSLYETKPSWQTDTGCTRRTIGDLAADADPNTGAAIYSGYSPYGAGWFVIGGTSLATPLVSGLIADAPAAGQSALLSHLYAAAGNSSLYDVITGANGHCAPAYLCTAGPGFDAPSGLGAPVGVSAL